MSENCEKEDVSDALDQVKLDGPVERDEQLPTVREDTPTGTESVHRNALSSYINQWQTYFTNHKTDEDLLNHLRSKAFKESLRSCIFRSICWRVSKYLNIFGNLSVMAASSLNSGLFCRT